MENLKKIKKIKLLNFIKAYNAHYTITDYSTLKKQDLIDLIKKYFYVDIDGFLKPKTNIEYINSNLYDKYDKKDELIYNKDYEPKDYIKLLTKKISGLRGSYERMQNTIRAVKYDDDYEEDRDIKSEYKERLEKLIDSSLDIKNKLKILLLKRKKIIDKAEPKKPEIKKAEPKKPDIKQAEPKHPEIKKAEPKKPEIKKAEPKKPEIKKEAKKPEIKQDISIEAKNEYKKLKNNGFEFYISQAQFGQIYNKKNNHQKLLFLNNLFRENNSEKDKKIQSSQFKKIIDTMDGLGDASRFSVDSELMDEIDKDYNDKNYLWFTEFSEAYSEFISEYENSRDFERESKKVRKEILEEFEESEDAFNSDIRFYSKEFFPSDGSDDDD